MVDPEPRRRAGKEVVMRGEEPPGGTAIGDRGAIAARDAGIVAGHAPAEEHPEQVAIGRQQECGGIRDPFVPGEPGRVGMAMRADDG